MAFDTNLAVRIATVLDNTGLKKADKGISKLQKSVRSLNLGFALTAAGATAFAKASVNAFIADEAAASKLSNAVKNLGMEFANPFITQYIADMEKMTKVADDQLRPAFQSLLNQTGSLAASQSALSTAIEVSRGSGIDLATVSNDLAMAYVGNTKGLKKYYLGLSSASLQAKSFTEIQKIMNDQFAGSSAAYLSTYSGQVGVLSLAWGNFQESVGGALLTMASFGSGGESQGLSNLATVLDRIGGAVTLISKGWNSVAKLFNITGEGGLLSKFNPYATSSGKTETKAANPMDKYATQLAKIEADRKKQNAAVLKSQKALTAEQKKQALSKKQSALFDLEQISIIAALKGKITEEEKLRLELQLALLTGNTSEADKLSQQLANSIDATGKLAESLRKLPDANNPFKAWDAFLDAIIVKARQAAQISTGSSGNTFTPTDLTGVTTPAVIQAIMETDAATKAALEAAAVADTISAALPANNVSASGNTFNVYVEGSVISDDDLVTKIEAGLRKSALSGSPSQIGRLYGMFS